MAWCALAEDLFNDSYAFRIILVGHPGEFLERDLLPLGLDEGRCARISLPFHVLDDAQAGLNLVVDVLRDEDHFLDDLLLVEKLGENVL